MLYIHKNIKQKLRNKHHIASPKKAVRQAFRAFKGLLLVDTREEHLVQDGVVTEWFIARIDGKLFKVVFFRLDNLITIKTMYEVDSKDSLVFWYFKTYKKLSGEEKKECRQLAKLMNKLVAKGQK